MTPDPKKKTYRSEDYLDFIRNQPCLKCGFDGDSEAHHEGIAKVKGMGMKVPDTHTVPLCFECHILRNQQGRKTFWKDRDIKLAIIGYLTLYLELELG